MHTRAQGLLSRSPTSWVTWGRQFTLSHFLFLQLCLKREAKVYPAGTDNSWYFLSTHYVSGWSAFQLSSH